jgi:hypothetical protein
MESLMFNIVGLNINYCIDNKNIQVLKKLCSVMLIYNIRCGNVFAYDESDLTTRQVIIRKTENFLTNPLLEEMRKIDQSDPDTTMNYSNRPLLLIPILEILEDVDKVSSLLKQHDSDSISIAKTILDNPKFDTPVFKKIFNRYSDNIFYSDPRRANLYLGGGAMPNSIQTQQYLFRNLALTSINNVKEDLKSLFPVSNSDQQSIDDAVDDCKEASDAVKNYLLLADPYDIEVAKKIITKSYKNS